MHDYKFNTFMGLVSCTEEHGWFSRRNPLVLVFVLGRYGCITLTFWMITTLLKNYGDIILMDVTNRYILGIMENMNDRHCFVTNIVLLKNKTCR